MININGLKLNEEFHSTRNASDQESVDQGEVFAPPMHPVPRQIQCHDHKFAKSRPKSGLIDNIDNRDFGKKMKFLI